MDKANENVRGGKRRAIIEEQRKWQTNRTYAGKETRDVTITLQFSVNQ